MISEFMASNSTGLQDEDGDYSDWIEIFNSGTNTANLDGWFLTDTPGNLVQWRFPATNLPPGGFLVVFASGKSRAIAGAPLHTNFKLDADGDYLALVEPDGVTIASAYAPRFPPQFANASYGVAQELLVTRLVSNSSPALVLVPTNGTLGTSWVATAFNDSAWRRGTNGIGYETYVPGFAIKNIRANIGVCDMGTAFGVLTNLSQQSSVFTENRLVVNYFNTGGAGNFGGDYTFPGFSMNVDENNFVTEATGFITIPTSGNWTFGVNSDDGFTATVGSYIFAHPDPRGNADTLATFNMAAGDYPVRLVFYECGGGSSVEFFAAAGAKSGYDSTFRLVGDSANGGLAVKSLPIGSGTSQLRPLITTDVQTSMSGRASSAYIRMPFTVADPAAFATLTLRMKYNDGFVAWLNGTEVARRNAPAAPQWNSTATSSRASSASVVFENIDLSSRLGLLQTGTNLLAIHGLNDGTNSSTFLILAELVENKVLGITNHYFSTPTPGAVNSSESFSVVDELRFNPDRGFYENTNFLVSILSTTPGTTIRYTTNGSAPSPSNGWVYTGPIRIGTTVALRAIGYRAAFEPTKVETHTYLFVDQVQRQSTNSNYPGGSAGNYTLTPSITQTLPYSATFKDNLRSIPTLSIAMAAEDFFGPAGINSNPTAHGIAWERPCSAEYLRPDGDKGFSVNCGIRIQGGVSRDMMPKLSMRLLFRKSYGPGQLQYNLFPDSAVQEFDTLVLHAGFNDHWIYGGASAQLQRDQWCRDAQNAMSGYGCHGVYAHLYVNGIYWGLYNIGERGDASFAAHYMGGDKEEYDAFNPDGVVDGDATAWNALFAIANAGITSDAAYTNISQYVDIPNLVDYMLMNFYAANTDWPWHNWNGARRRAPGAGLHFFSWDAEWTFGIGNNVNTDVTGVNGGAPGTLYNALRAHPEFRREFGDRVQRYCFNNGPLTPGAADALWMARADEIEQAVIPELARWGNGNMPSTWKSQQSAVRTWFPQRTAILLGQLRSAGLFPQLTAPAFAPFGGLVPPGYSLALTNPNTSGAVYFTMNGADPRRWGAGVAPTAQLYASPLLLTNACVLRARVRDGTNWSALAEATFYVVQDFRGLVVSEIMYHPPNYPPYTGDELEFIELKNTGTTTLDLSGLQFTDGITFSFTNGTRLAPNQFFLLVRNPTAFAYKYPGVSINGVYSGKLDNGGEKLTLSHVLGTNAFSFSYNNKTPWPITPDGYGFSLVRANPSGDPDAPSTWRPSANLWGSPGAEDPAFNIPPILINEILTSPLLVGSELTNDAIELYNPTGVNVDVGGWFVSDDAAQPKKYRIPAGTIIPAGQYLVFTESQFNPQPGIPPSFGLSSQGESVCLFSGNSATNLTGYSHSFDFGAAANGVSFGRYVISTGEEHWPAQADVTLTNLNAGPRVGPIIINEIMYHPPLEYDEFIELYNNSDSAVPLYDPAYPTNTWKLGGLAYTFSNSVSIPAGGFLILSPIDPALFRAKYSVPWNAQIVGPYPGVLQDSGERLRLERPGTPIVGTNGVVTVPYIVMDEVRYNDKLPWPPTADGEGPSLQRRLPTDFGNEPTNWFASGVSPGQPNTYNQPPWCAVLWPENGANFDFPATITLTAAASDADGLVTRVEFYDGEIKLGEATSAPFSWTWANVPAGNHQIIAKARDNRLGVTISATVNISVNPPPIGNGVGLAADYYDNADFTGAVVHRTNAVVNFDWGGGQPDPAIGADTFSVRWLGRVQPRFSETYTFYTVSDDGIRLWVNNQLLVDNWTDHGPTENSGIVALQAGYLYDLRMEMYENGGGAVAQLLWSSPTVAKEVIPSTQLYLPAASNLPPIIALTAPTPGEVFVAGSTLNLAATASDPDGVVAKVEFFAGTAKLGERTNRPYAMTWSNAPAGQLNLFAVATDNSGANRASAPAQVTILAGYVTNLSLVSTGAVWKYYDAGGNLGSDWNTVGYNDSAWTNGPAQLGYGEGDEQTEVSYGGNPLAKHISTYFRTEFTVTNLPLFTALSFRLLRDDSAIVYLNGSEVYRDNLPPGSIDYLTLATNDIEGALENVWRSGSIDPGYLVPGRNVLAVEVHQFSGSSTDLSFDFELSGAATLLAPYITAQPQNQSLTEGDNALFSVSAQGTGPLRYEWRFNNTALPGETNATLLLTNIQLAQQGNYQVLVGNDIGTVLSSNAFLTVRPPVQYPVIFTQQPRNFLLPGSTNAATYGQTFSNLTFSVAVTGTLPIRFQWRKDGVPINGATNAALTVYNASLADTGVYTLAASNVLGVVVSDPGTLVVTIAPAILQAPPSLTVVTGSMVNLSVAARGHPLPLSYRWKRDADNLTNIVIPQTNCTLTLTNVQLANGGAYVVVVTNAASTTPMAVSPNAYLTVVAPPVNQPANLGASATFSILASAGNYSSRLRYQWQFNGVNLPNATNALLTLSNLQPAQIGTYTVVVTNPANFPTSFSAELLAFPVSFTQHPQSVTLAGSTSEAAYGQTFSNITFSAAAAGTTPINWQWLHNGEPIPGATGNTLTIANASLANQGTYSLRASNAISVSVSQPATLAITLTPTIRQHPQSLTVVTGSTAALSVVARGQPLPLGYRWKRDADNLTTLVLPETNCTLLLTNVDLTNSGAYMVIITNSAYSTLFAASSNAYLTVVVPPADQTAPTGTNVTFTVQARAGNHTARLRFQWQFNGLNLAGATNAIMTITNVQLSDQGLYTVMVTNPVNVSTSYPATLTLIPSVERDTDRDGLPDWWEVAHSLDFREPADAAQDPDHDGMTNLQEYLAGTDPQDAQSYLKIEQIEADNTLCVLQFLAVSNKTYTVLYLDSLLSPTWQRLTNSIAAPTNRLQVITDTNGLNGQRFYRLTTPALP